MAIHLSHRAKAINPSPTLTVSALAKQMQEKGINVINFGVGEPDFNTPQKIKDCAHQAIKDNFTRYTNTSGISSLREAISAKLKRDNDLDCSVKDILVSPGAKASIMFILMAICDPRDEVLIPTPYWVSYNSQVEMVDAHPIFIPTTVDSDFKISVEQLEESIETLSSPRALILNTPNNPTGSVYTQKELEEIAQICLKHNLIIIADEIYEKLVYEGEKHYSIANISKEVREHTVLINGVSKAYEMTGWRLGYAAGPVDIIKSAARIQSHTTSCVNSITQKAAICALDECEDDVQKMRFEFQKRRDILIDGFKEIPHIKYNVPKGAFYAMPDISYYLQNANFYTKSSYFKKTKTKSVRLCEYLIKEHKVAVVPGSAFGVDNYVRFSYANSIDNIKEGLKNFKRGLAESLKR